MASRLPLPLLFPTVYSPELFKTLTRSHHCLAQTLSLSHSKGKPEFQPPSHARSAASASPANPPAGLLCSQEAGSLCSFKHDLSAPTTCSLCCEHLNNHAFYSTSCSLQERDPAWLFHLATPPLHSTPLLHPAFICLAAPITVSCIMGNLPPRVKCEVLKKQTLLLFFTVPLSTRIQNATVPGTWKVISNQTLCDPLAIIWFNNS